MQQLETPPFFFTVLRGSERSVTPAYGLSALFDQ